MNQIRLESKLLLQQKELEVLKARSEKEFDVLKARSEKDLALLKLVVKQEGLEIDRVQGVLSLRSATERIEVAPQNDFGSSKQRSQKWLHFLRDTGNGQQLFTEITQECSPDVSLTEGQVAELVQRLYKLLSEEVHRTGGRPIGDKIFFPAPSWVTKDQQCFLRATVKEAYGKAAVIGRERPEAECESDACESPGDGP